MRITLNKIVDYLANRKRLIIILLFLISVATTVQNITCGLYHFWDGEYTFYNNYVIFKSSFAHLIKDYNLYQPYPDEYGDHYKYSPTFALFMIIFHPLPDALGLVLWY